MIVSVQPKTTAAGCEPGVVDQRVGAVDTPADALAGGDSFDRPVLLGDTHGLQGEISIPDGDVLIHAGNFCSEGEAVEARSLEEFFRGHSVERWRSRETMPPSRAMKRGWGRTIFRP